MALTSLGKHNTPSYLALSSDISAGKIARAANIGGTVYLTDTGVWKIIKDDLTLGDYNSNWGGSMGVSGAAVISSDITSATAITDVPTTGEKIILTDLIFSAEVAMDITFAEETSETVLFKVFLPATGFAQITPKNKTKLATVNKKITAKASIAGKVGITAYYYSEV